MKLRLKDKTEITVTEAQADIIMQMLEKKVEFIKVNGSMMHRNLIAGIFPGGISEADVPNFDTPALPSGKKCRGQYSIQNEINMIAKNEHPSDWSKLITNSKWREQTRQALRQSDASWCDYKKNECVCEAVAV